MSENDNELEVEIQFFSTLKNVTEKDSISIQIENGTPVLDILTDIQEKYFIPNDSRILDPSNETLETGIICLINDADVKLTGGLRQKIDREGKTITLISSLHGG